MNNRKRIEKKRVEKTIVFSTSSSKVRTSKNGKSLPCNCSINNTKKYKKIDPVAKEVNNMFKYLAYGKASLCFVR
ncbi:MAG: hypothetical protein WC872_00750 [Candidatus Absconditabacterales bacterium]|jgi:hypothetical protein